MCWPTFGTLERSNHRSSQRDDILLYQVSGCKNLKIVHLTKLFQSPYIRLRFFVLLIITERKERDSLSNNIKVRTY